MSEIVNFKELSEAEEAKIIRNKYRQLLRYCDTSSDADKVKIRKAFNFALQAHTGVKRKSGEPYILHPLEVALIATRDIGLKTTSVICALIHDVVEDTDYTIKDIEVMFGKKVAKIVDGLTKISEIFGQSESLQAENYRKILLTLVDDVRVILIKLADRLHNMRTLESMSLEKQMKISSETSTFYAPLAHRLGLFGIKSELEDLVLKYKNPDAYRIISSKLELGEIDRKRFIAKFILPIKQHLTDDGLNFKIIYRDKSVSSIWQKMQTKKVSFEQVYDLFAVRIILDSSMKNEKSDCWKTYSAITETYVPKHDRFRDWISMPKANGYEALHTTVMSKSGKWVEVQIRSVRMDEIAEKGYAAHWKYKGKAKSEGGLDEWLTKIREQLQNPDSNALDFLDDFKLNLFSDEIYAFSPKGGIKTLAKGSTVIDFAYAVHSQIGDKAIGAKVNNELVPLNHRLHSGDQIEILTSNKQRPKEDWINWAFTSRAKGQIKNAISLDRKNAIIRGKAKMKELCQLTELKCNKEVITAFLSFVGIQDENDLYQRLDLQKIGEEDVRKFIQFNKEQSSWTKYLNPFSKKVKATPINDLSDQIRKTLKKKPEGLLLSKKYDNAQTDLATCCKPIPGDDVIGFIKKDGSINIHRTTCEEASILMSTYGNNIIKVKWREGEDLQFLTGIRLYGQDNFGLIQKITNILTSEMGINIRSFSLTTNNDLFEGQCTLYVSDITQLKSIIDQLQKIEGIEKIYRMD